MPDFSLQYKQKKQKAVKVNDAFSYMRSPSVSNGAIGYRWLLEALDGRE